ncbi:MAG: hypothetical protein IKE69_11365 [Thermoguttaceae bacterium]|nr:hypothetical protein [Thermoguttaceae bacterium]
MGTLFQTSSRNLRPSRYRRICLEELETRSLLSVNPIGIDDSPAICEGVAVEPELPVRFDVAAEEKPDLYTLSVTAVDYYTGETLEIDGGVITVENLPNITVTYVNGGDAAVTEKYFYSAVRVRNTDTGEYVLYDATGRWYERYSPGYEGPAETGTFRFLIPKLSVGNYAMEIQLNNRGSVDESDEANDYSEIRFSVGEPIPAKPDIAFSSVTASDYYTGATLELDGGTITTDNLPEVTVNFVNRGNAAVDAKYFYSAVRVRNDDTGAYVLKDAAGNWYERYCAGYEEPGETGSFRFLIPKLAAGNYSIELQLNNRGSVDESDDSDDYRLISFCVTDAVPAKPDLAIVSVAASDYYTGATLELNGGEITTDNLPEVTVNFGNRGNAAVDAKYFYSAVRVRNVDTGAYVLKDAAGNWYERYCAGYEEPGETGSFRFLIPKLAAGNYQLEIRLNSRGSVDESDVSDDYAEYFFTVVRPADEMTDIVLTDWVGIYDGESHAITVTDPSAATDTILFSADGLTYDLTENPAYTEIGSYTTYVKVSRSGYQDWFGSAEIVIGEVPPPDYKIDTVLAVTTSIPSETEVDVVSSVSEVTVGDTIYVSVYAKSTDSRYGVQGGYCSLRYEPEAFIAGDYIASSLYPLDTILDGYDFSADHYISAFGGNPSGVREAYGQTEWALVGTQSFVATSTGEYTFSNGPAINDKGAEKETWSFVREDYPFMRDYGNSYDSVSLTVVEKSPYKIDTCVAVTTECPHEAEVDAVSTVSEVGVGDTIYVSVYVRSTDSNYGILGGYCSLHYDSDAFTAGEYIASPLYSLETILDGFSYSGDDYISAFGGNPEGVQDVYGKTRWALVGTQVFTADAAGEYSFSSGMALNANGIEKESWSFVREDFAFIREYANRYDSVTMTVIEPATAGPAGFFADPDFVDDVFSDF